MRRVLFILALLMLIVPTPAQAGSPAKSIKFSCKTAGVATLDPILVPNGGPSPHEHMFTGNLGVPNGVHTYNEAITKGTTCQFTGDTGSYWEPTVRVMGTIMPVKHVIYYDKMVASQPVTPFPPDLGIIAGFGHAPFNPKQRSVFGWNCDNNELLQPTFEHVDCSGYSSSSNVVTLRIFFPYCWDGVDPGIRDFSEHVFYPTNYPTNQLCPAGAKVFPRIRVNFNFQVKKMPAGAVYSSDTQFGTSFGGSAHADFWNTWQQSALEGLVAQLNS